MTIIPLAQGPVKQSEVAADQALPLLSTNINEDGQTLLTQMQNVMGNVLRKTSFLLISDGVITWNGTNITNNGNNLLLKLNQNPTTGLVSVLMPTAVLSTFTLTNAEILYFVTTRSALAAGSFTATIGNFVVSTEGTMPAMQSPQSDSANDPTIYVPLLSRYDIGPNQSVWWVPHGIYWPQNTTSVVGSLITGTVIPNGSIQALNVPGTVMPIGSPTLATQNPGWAICDGAVIVNPQSPFNNTTRNAAGFPLSSFSPSLDRFTAQLNGAPAAWVTGTAYNIGDPVVNTGFSLLWVALSNFTAGTGLGWDPNAGLPAAWSAATSYTVGQFVTATEASVNGSGFPVTIIYHCIATRSATATTPFNDPTHWQMIWGTDTTQRANPFFRASRNGTPYGTPNTFLRGTLGTDDSSGAYGGENTNVHTHSMQSHTHSLGPGAAELRFDTSGSGNIYAGMKGTGGWTETSYVNKNGGNFTLVDGGSYGTGTRGISLIGSTDVPSTGSTGTNTDTNNQPNYYNVLYIQKIY